MRKMARHKTDKVDAGIIAEYGAKFGGVSYAPTAENVKELRECYRASLALKEQLICVKNHLENKELLPISVRNVWENLAKTLENEIKNLEKYMKKIIFDDLDLKLKFELLTQIPGIGDGTAIAILAEITHLENFKTARNLAAFIGLTPRFRMSGSSVRGKTRISKMGLKLLRKALYFPAITAMQLHPKLKFFANSLKERGKITKQIICAVMRKPVHEIFCVLKYDFPRILILPPPLDF